MSDPADSQMSSLETGNHETAGIRWFRRVVWLSIIVNLCFALPGLIYPDLILTTLGLSPLESTVWLRNAAMLVLAVSLFYIPAAMSPSKYPVFAWLTVASRLIAAVFWLQVASSTPALRPYFFTDLSFGLVEAFLLQIGFPQELRLSPGSMGRVIKGWIAATGSGLHSGFVRALIVLALILTAGLGAFGWYFLLRTKPDTQFASVEDHFKHGAIGLGLTNRIPTILWKTMPVICSDKLPGGWPSLGFVYEKGKGIPVGMSERFQGFPQLEPNCAMCHTGTYRKSPSDEAHIMLGSPANTLDLEAFQDFLYACAADPRFTANNILKEYEKTEHISFLQAAAYRYAILPFSRYGLLQQRQAYAWQLTRPRQGPGRTDTFNPTKINVFHLADDGSIGTTDLPQIWDQRPREKMYLHWDGNNNNLMERNYAAAMAIGATSKSVIPASFKRVTDFLLDLKPPAFPFPVKQDAALRGQTIFQQQCASCHGFGGAKTGTVTPISVIGTDRHRLDSFTSSLVEKFHSVNDPPFKFDAYRKTDGYSNLPLDGVWARGPYLHNGSVPTLWDLLQPVEKRPQAFYRGCNLIDPVKVGFVCETAQKTNFLYDTHIPGNGNMGHLYGTDLKDQQKWDLIEYMKTL